MAQRDYAKRRKSGSAASRRASPAPETRTRSETAASRNSTPLILLSVAALCALGVLIYFLISTAPTSSDLSSQAEQRQTAPQTSTVEIPPAEDSKPVTRAPGDALPLDDVEINPSERFGFYDLLQENEVQLPEESAYTSTPKTAALENRYLLQAGSFRNQSDAEAMRARLLLENLPNVRTERTEGSNGVWFRVTTGPFETFAELRNATNRLEKLNIHPMQRRLD